MKKKQKQGYSPDEVANELGHIQALPIHLGTRRMFIVGSICEHTASAFLPTFHALDQTPGPIYITLNTEGGSLDHGLAIYDAIKLSNNLVVIDGTGMVQSAGMLIMQAGDIRRSTPETRFMVHEVSMGTHGDTDFDASELRIRGQEGEFNNARIVRVLGERSSLTDVEIADMCKVDFFFTPDQALKYGYIDDILDTPSKPSSIVLVEKYFQMKAKG